MMNIDDFIIVQEDFKSSRRQYRLYCDSCKKDRGYHRITKRDSAYCRDCFGTMVHKNKVVSSATRLKMKASHHLNNGGKHPLLGKNHTEETKIKLSKAAVRQNKNYIAVHKYEGPVGLINMKSSWEVKYANWLDTQHISWIYEPEFILSNGYSYLPDFQLSSSDIIEIKGYMREDAQKKWDLFCLDYPDLKKSLLRKNDLMKLGLI